MKLHFCIIALLLSAISCNTTSNKSNAAVDPETLPQGTLILSDSVRIMEDELNQQYFSVKLYTTANTGKGTYQVDVALGNNTAMSKFTLPKSDKKLTPVLRKISNEYTYYIGFHYGEDTTFYDYYGVYAEKGMIKMKYLKAYKFE